MTAGRTKETVITFSTQSLLMQEITKEFIMKLQKQQPWQREKKGKIVELPKLHSRKYHVQ